MSPPRPALIDDGFAEFWQRYPRKRAKADALKAWKAIKMTPALFELIMMQLELQIRHDFSYRKKEMIPYPGTWIRAESWEDEIDLGNGSEALEDDRTVDIDARAELVHAYFKRELGGRGQQARIPTIEQIKQRLAKMQEGE